MGTTPGRRVGRAGRAARAAGIVLVTSSAFVAVTVQPAAAGGPMWPAGTDCPSTSCPYGAPTSTEQGFADDDLARINLERTAPQRDYTDSGATVSLPDLTMDPALQETAQAAAEYLAAQQTLMDYGGTFPDNEVNTGANAGGPALDSAVMHEAFMESPGHAGAELAAAPDFAGIGVACDASGRAWVIELFANADMTAWDAGQERMTAELASNGVPQTENGQTFTGFPTQPIVAGENNVYATGSDWTCSGPRYAPGSAPTSPLASGLVTGIASTPDGGGYWTVDAFGEVDVHGDAGFHRSMAGHYLAAPVDHIVATPDGGGYWLVASDGGVFAFGDAGFFGSMGGRPLSAPVVDLAPTPDGGGYWLVGSDGGVFAFGDARFLGSVPGVLPPGEALDQPVNGVTAAVGGYRLVASDGGIFSFGAPFYGSMGGQFLAAPVVGMASSADGLGYWMVASDGGIFCYGDAQFHGSMGGQFLAARMVGMAPDPVTGGYWLVGADGGVFAFDAPFHGSS